MAHNRLASKNGTYNLHEVARAGVGKATTGPRTMKFPRNTVRTPRAVYCRFRPEQWVYNRDTKEHGLVRHVYEKNGVTMYKAWLPARPDLLRWGHFVSDWAEDVLERADNAVAESSGSPTRF
jgi:hypothetical protein